MIAAGIGCKRGAPASDIEAAIHVALSGAQIGADALDVIATIEAKTDEPGIRAAAEKFGISLLIVPAPRRAASADRLKTHSERVSALIGVGSVAEAAALAAAGCASQLIVPRLIVGAATCALAASPRESTP